MVIFKIHINLWEYKGNMGLTFSITHANNTHLLEAAGNQSCLIQNTWVQILEGQAAGHPNRTLSDEEVVPKEESTESATAG